MLVKHRRKATRLVRWPHTFALSHRRRGQSAQSASPVRFGCVHFAFLPFGGRLMATMNRGDGSALPARAREIAPIRSRASAEPPTVGVIIGVGRSCHAVLGRNARAAASTSAKVTRSKWDAMPHQARARWDDRVSPSLGVDSVGLRLGSLWPSESSRRPRTRRVGGLVQRVSSG